MLSMDLCLSLCRGKLIIQNKYIDYAILRLD